MNLRFVFINLLFVISLPAGAEVSWATTAPTHDESLYTEYRAAFDAENRADTKLARDSYTFVIETLKASPYLSDTPLHARALYRRAFLAYRSGDTPSAFADFHTIITDFCHCANADRAAFLMGTMKAAQCNDAEAIEYFKMIVEERVGHGVSTLLPTAYWAWIKAADRLGKCDEAAKLCHDLIQVAPETPEAEAAKTYLETQ